MATNICVTIQVAKQPDKKKRFENISVIHHADTMEEFDFNITQNYCSVKFDDVKYTDR